MSLIEYLTMLANIAVGVIVILCVLLALGNMRASTKHRIRFSFLAMGGSAFALVMMVLRDPEQITYAQTGLGISFAMYLLLDRRRYDKLKQQFAGPPSAPGGA